MKNRFGRRRFTGQGLVEFALVVPIFFLMLIGVMEMGRLLWMNHELTNGTREAARYAMVHGSEASTCVTLDALTQENDRSHKRSTTWPVEPSSRQWSVLPVPCAGIDIRRRV